MGSRLLEKDAQAAALQDLALKKGAQDLELGATHAQLYGAQARKLSAEATRMERQDKALAEWLANKAKGGGKAADPDADPMETAVADLIEQADFQRASGDLEGSRKTLGTMSSVVSRAAMVAQREASALKTQFEAQKKAADTAVSYLRGAKSQDDLRLAGDRFEMDYGFRPPVFNMQYSPEAVEAAVQTGMSEIQSATAQHQKQMERYRERELGIRDRLANSAVARAEAFINNANARTSRIEKAGGKPDTAMTPTQRRELTEVLTKEFPDLPPEERNVMAASVASAARARIRQNPSMSWDQAKLEALTDARADIQEVESDNKVKALFGAGKRKRFNPLGRTPSTALPPPKSMKEAVTGKYYTTPRGILRYLGNGKFAAPDTGISDSMDDDEDEET